MDTMYTGYDARRRGHTKKGNGQIDSSPCDITLTEKK